MVFPTYSLDVPTSGLIRPSPKIIGSYITLAIYGMHT
jgi:hypothetical protein